MAARVKQVLQRYGRTAFLFHSSVFVATLTGSYAAINQGVDLEAFAKRVPFMDLSKVDPDAGTLALAYLSTIVVHGIPDSRPLEDGDIVNIDISVFLDGFHGDTSQTYIVGENVDEAGRHLVDVTNQALEGAIENCCKPLNRFATIGDYVQTLADKEDLGVVREYTGHGIGKEFHCLPFILHNRNGEPGKMLPGMAFTVEPALTEGSPKIIHWDDGWTVATADGGRSAQAEHTVLITEDGADILT
ncbi:hypothetical protein BBJ29_005538 [Phytophthora kernoviae]|uniref:Methionine aminopeptidase n=1 Tax=Phytophthora kernoviae TaxID=325452 RepID=A0A3F2RMD8_9STRA|nr:hypothetical protein BBP00_00005966 [Phytophthora kernoviae]RLN65892.1 hypothetical protein BBJ29_005538 [Phytophthora kernoviae]